MAVVAVVQVLDAQMRVLADLENVAQAGIEQRFHELWTASFTMPAGDPKCGLCVPLRLVRFRDADGRNLGLFRIMPYTDGRRGQRLDRQYRCEHVLATLMDDMLVGRHNVDPASLNLEDALEYVLSHQSTVRWQLGTVAAPFLDKLWWQYWDDRTLLQAILEALEPLGEGWKFQFHTTTQPWTLDIIEPPEDVTGYMDAGRNLEQLTRETDPRSLVTRLYPYGRGVGADQVRLGWLAVETGHTIDYDGDTYTIGRSSAPPGDTSHIWLDDSDWPYVWRLYDSEEEEWYPVVPEQADVDAILGDDYLDADTQGQYGIIVRTWEEQRMTTPEELLEAAQDRLERLKVPRVNYTIQALDLARITGSAFDRLELGARIRVVDPELGIDEVQRITSITRADYINRPEDVAVVIGEREEFPRYGDIMYADDLDQVRDGGAFGRVLTTQIDAGRIILSAIQGGTVGPYPFTPRIAGLYVGATHFGFHDGADWRTFMDLDGRFRLVGREEEDFLKWKPGEGQEVSELEIQGKVTLRPGSVGYQFLADAPIGVTRSFWQDEEPDPEQVEVDENDIWFDTSDGNKIHYWDGEEWVEGQDHDIGQAMLDALQAYNLAETRIKTYFQPTEPDPGAVDLVEGDLWVNTGDNNKVSRWNGSIWQAVTGAVAALNVIGSAHIDELAVNEGHIASCSIDSLTAGDLDAGTIRLTGGDIRSDNYSPGTAGWRIRHDGQAEFQNALIRGTLNASDITAGTLDVARISNRTISGIKLALRAVGTDEIGLNAVTPTRIQSVNANQINAGIITGSTLRTAASGTRIEVNSGVPAIYIYSGASLRLFMSPTQLTTYAGYELRSWGGNLVLNSQSFSYHVHIPYYLSIRSGTSNIRFVAAGSNTSLYGGIGNINVNIGGIAGHLRVYSGHRY